MSILVTGAAGMIGSKLTEGLLNAGYEVVGVDLKDADGIIRCDLGDIAALEEVVIKNRVDKIIHLAALAHTEKGVKYTNEQYYHANVECAENVFNVAAKYEISVLFISTVDVYGFQKGVVNADTPCKPVTVYGKTKLYAEMLLKESGAPYDIFRFAPVYTETIKRDIQKRYYLKYPDWAYIIGNGGEYEVLNIELAVSAIIDWCNSLVGWFDKKPGGSIKIIKDEKPLSTVECVVAEREAGRAKHILHFPLWLVKAGYGILRITGKNKYTYLLSKAVKPLRTE